MKMDVSKFKRVSTDAKKTVLMHPSGHKIVIAHGGLSKDNLGALNSLPGLYAEPKAVTDNGGNMKLPPPSRMAEGGDVAQDFKGVQQKIGNWATDGMSANQLAASRMQANPPADTGGLLTPGQEELARQQQEAMSGPAKGQSMADGGEAGVDQDPDSDIFENASGANARNTWNSPRAKAARAFGLSQNKLNDIDQYPLPANVKNFAQGGGVQHYAEGTPDAVPSGTDQEAAALQGLSDTPPPPNVPAPDTPPGDAAPDQEADVASTPDYPTAGKAMPEFPPYASPPGAANDPYATANKTALGGLQKQGEAAQQTATAMGDLGAREAAADSMAANSLNHISANFQKTYQDLTADRNAQYHDWQQGHIDPEHYIKNMSTGHKIMTGIGLILGGMGSGLTHQPNLAFEFLNNQINRDVEAQRTDMANKSNLFTANLNRTGDLINATNMTRMNALDLNSMHIKQLAAGMQDPVQKANALGIAGKLDQEASQVQQGIATRQALMQASGQGGEQAFQARNKILRVMGQDKFADQEEKKHVPGVGNASREVPGDVLSQINSRDSLDSALKDLMNFSNQHSGTINPSIMAQGNAKAALVQDMARRASNAGVFKESEKDFMNSFIGQNPTQLFAKFRSGKGYQEAARSNQLELNSLKQTYGLPVTSRQQGAAASTPNIQMRGGIKYQKVPGGWKKVQ
jgi:hypothetical protein